MKKVLLILLTFVMLLSLCACGNDDTQTADPSTSPSQTTTNSTQQTTGSTEATTGETQIPTNEPTTAPTDGPATPPTQASTEAPTTKPTTCSHSYKDATCTAPKTCTKCGATEGGTAEHSWSAATCTAPKTCSKCGATEGSATGHTWKDATYTNPKTCTVCHATEGSPLARETQEITITTDNWSEYFEIKRKDIIPEKNAFGEYGTPEDMYYNLELVLKEQYSANLVSINVSIEFVMDTYLKSYDYDKSTGIGTVTNDYKKDYNNTDTALCNFNNSKKAYICSCHHAGVTEIAGKAVYYAYICESVKCTRAAGTIVLQK